MSELIIGNPLPNIPWEDRPAGCEDVVWRSERNPIITRSAIKNSNSVFNSAVVPYQGEFRGVFRSDDKTRMQKLHSGAVKTVYIGKSMMSLFPLFSPIRKSESSFLVTTRVCAG